MSIWPWESAIEKVLDILKPLFRKKKATEVFADAGDIWQACRELVREDYNLNIDFCFLMMAHNGDRKLNPHGFKYKTIIGGDYKEGWMKNFKFDNYVKIWVDFEYCELLTRIGKYKEVNVLGGNLREGKLKTNYEFEKIRFCKYIFLKENKEAMWYIAIGTTMEGELFEETRQKQEIDWMINETRNIIKKY